MLPQPITVTDLATLVQLIEVTSTRGAYGLEEYLSVKNAYDHLVDALATAKQSGTPPVVNPGILQQAVTIIEIASKKNAFVLPEFAVIANLHKKLVNAFNAVLNTPAAFTGADSNNSEA